MDSETNPTLPTVPLKVVYTENGVPSTFWRRALHSKTTAVVMGYALSKAEPLFQSDAWMQVDNWKTFGQTVMAGVGVILIRSALKQLQLSNEALNPGIMSVQAVEVPKKSGVNGPILGLLALTAVSAPLALPGCTGESQAEICVTDPVTGQKVCYPINKPRPPQLPPPPPAPAPPGPQLAK